METTDNIVLQNRNTSAVSFSPGFGFIYFFNDLQTGVCFYNLILNETEVKGIKVTRKRQIQLHASYSYELQRDIFLEPYMFFVGQANSRWLYTLSCNIRVQKNYWAGLSLSENMGFGISLGLQLYKSIVFNYAYRYSGSEVFKYSPGSQEISLGVTLDYKQHKTNL